MKNNDSSIEFQIGNQGTGEATIREGGLITAENTIIGGNATGIGTPECAGSRLCHYGTQTL